MLLSSGVVWRYRSFEEFRAQCPGGDERLQRLIVERLDEGLEWLEALGAPAAHPRDRKPADDRRPLRPEGLAETLLGAATSGSAT